VLGKNYTPSINRVKQSSVKSLSLEPKKARFSFFLKSSHLLEIFSRFFNRVHSKTESKPNNFPLFLFDDTGGDVLIEQFY
jgi:hypothetical protein